MELEQEESSVTNRSWRIARRPSSLGDAAWPASSSSGNGGGLLKTSHTFPSPLYTRLGQSRPTRYSRHSSGQIPQHHPTAYYQGGRRLSHDLTPTRTTQWPVRPLRLSLDSAHIYQKQPLSPTISGAVLQSAATGRVAAERLSLVKMYCGQLQDAEAGIPTQERKVEGKLLKVFTGADGLEWFLQNMVGVDSIEQAKRVGTQLVGAGLIVNVSGHGVQSMCVIACQCADFPSGNIEFYGSPNALYQFSGRDSSHPSTIDARQTTQEPRRKSGNRPQEQGRAKCSIQ